jgi:uncharacterized protein (DUF2384 family)
MPHALARDPRDFVALRIDSARRAFRSDAEIAAVLDVDPAQLSRWKRGQTPDPENADRLAGLDLVVQMLSGYLSPSRLRKWLQGPNVHLNDRSPIALLRMGAVAEVLTAVQALKSGVHG